VVASVEAGELSFGYCRAGGQPLLPVETFAYGGVAAWRVAPRVAPARSEPLKMTIERCPFYTFASVNRREPVRIWCEYMRIRVRYVRYAKVILQVQQKTIIPENNF
jgi:hypothetical protein